MHVELDNEGVSYDVHSQRGLQRTLLKLKRVFDERGDARQRWRLDPNYLYAIKQLEEDGDS